MSTVLYRRRPPHTLALDQNPAHRRLLYIFTYVASLSAIQIMHLALDDLPLNVALSAGLTAGFVYSYHLGPRWRALTTYWVSGLAVVVSMIYFLRIRADETMLGNYLGILAGILIVLLAFKAFSPADHRFMLMFAVVFLLYSSVASYDLKFMLLLPLFLVFAGLSLYMANQVDVAERVAGTTGQQPVLHFAVSFGFVSILLRAVLGIIALSIVAYLLTPHTGRHHRGLVLNAAPIVDQPLADDRDGDDGTPGGAAVDPTAEIGLGDDFDLTDTRRLSADPRPVLQMKSHRNGYLRAQIFDVYTGSGWVKSPGLQQEPQSGEPTGPVYNLEMWIQPELLYPPVSSSFAVPLVDFPSADYAALLEEKHAIKHVRDNIESTNVVTDLGYDMIRQEIRLLETQPAYYFAMYQPFRLENISLTRAGGLLDTPVLEQTAALRANTRGTVHPPRFTYTVYSLEPRAGAKQLGEVYSPGPDGIVRPYTQVPLDEEPDPSKLAALGIEPGQYRVITQRLINFAKRFDIKRDVGDGQKGPASVWAKVQAIHEFLNDPAEFTYSRQFEPIDSEQELTEAFCLGTQEGYCRQFASSMAVLCRLNGIPARVVTGYAPGRFSLIDNAYIYKASNAHAWVEVYFDGYGWITVDPTPAGGSGRARRQATRWLSAVLDFLQEMFIIDPAGTQRTILALLGRLAAGAVQRWPLTLGLAILLAAATLGYRFWRRARLRARRVTFVPENSVVAAYVTVADELRRLGLRRLPHQTARDYLTAAAAQLAALAEPLASLVPLYERAAFAPPPVSREDVYLAQDVALHVTHFVNEELERRKRT